MAKRKFSSVAPTTEDFPDPQEHISATVAYHSNKGHLIPASDDGVPPWQAEDKSMDERLEILAAAWPECITDSWGLRRLGRAIGYSGENIRRNSKWWQTLQENPELIKRAAAKAILKNSQEYHEQFGDNDG